MMQRSVHENGAASSAVETAPTKQSQNQQASANSGASISCCRQTTGAAYPCQPVTRVASLGVSA